MNARIPFFAAVLLLAAAPGFWRKDREPEPEPEPEVTEPAPAPKPAVPKVPAVEQLFPDGLPVDVGGVPAGLANLSAQGCNACHYGAHEGWAASAHAQGWASPAYRTALREADDPACGACHQPLVAQSPKLHPPGAAEPVPNPAWDATLQSEGVTCAACHVRDGRVVGPRPYDGAPHPAAFAAQLRTSEACAPCHQLTWPGADAPLYDTWGEWSRSAQGRAGIQCQDCHMGPGAGAEGFGPNHAFPADPARAVSLLIEADGARLVRGGAPLAVTLRLQNTGAGHAFPTGSPFRGVRLRAVLARPEQGEEPRAEAAELITVLGRTLEDTPPWRTLEDTRLRPGGERSWSWRPALALDDPGGSWWIEVTLQELVRGEPSSEPFLVRRVPLSVD